MVGVGAGEGSCLKKAPTASGIAQLCPTDASSVFAGDVDGMVDEERLVVREVAIRGAVHGELAQRVEPSPGAGLRYTRVEGAKIRVELGGGYEANL